MSDTSSKPMWNKPPSRSGIGANRDEWEAPQRLSSSIRGGGRDKGGGYGTGECTAESKDGEDEVKPEHRSTLKLLGDQGGVSTIYNDEEETSEREYYGKEKNKGWKGQETDSEDEEFERDFYLSEEAQTLRDDSSSTTLFMGNAQKFKEREEVMAKSRSRGDTKIAGVCMRTLYGQYTHPDGIYLRDVC